MGWVFFAIAMGIFWSIMWSGKGPGGQRRRLDAASERRIDALEADVASRDEIISLLEARVGELENRLDFAERMLTSGRVGEQGER